LLAEFARLYETSTGYVLGITGSPEPVGATAKMLMSEEAWVLIAALQGLAAEQRTALLRLLSSKHAADALRAFEDETTHQILALSAAWRRSSAGSLTASPRRWRG
jgi:hypothetical protein